MCDLFTHFDDSLCPRYKNMWLQHELIDVEVSDNKNHLANIGRLIEDLESDMRAHLDSLYILKTREVVNSIRTAGADPKLTQLHVDSLKQAVLGHGKSKSKDAEI
jgi:hypothetical protein